MLLDLLRAYRKSIDWFAVNAYKRALEDWRGEYVKTLEKQKETSVLDEQDPVLRMQREIHAVSDRYMKMFSRTANKRASKIVTRVENEVRRRTRLELAGKMTVKRTLTPRMTMLMRAASQQSVSYIKSIQQEYHKRLEFTFTDSLMHGRDMNSLYKRLARDYGITRRRAIFLANDQINKMTENVDRELKMDLGFYRGIWRHSNIPEEPRASHVAADGKEFDIRKGCYIDGKWIQPAEEPGCNCFREMILDI